MSVLEKLVRHVETKGKLRPTDSADVNPRYLHAAREIARETTGDYAAFDQELEKLVEGYPVFVRRLPRNLRDGANEFCDELILIAANEIARKLMSVQEEEFYVRLGRRMIEEGTKEQSPLFEMTRYVPMKTIYFASAIMSENFNSVTRMKVLNEPFFDFLRVMCTGQRKEVRKLTGAAWRLLSKGNLQYSRRVTIRWETTEKQIQRYEEIFDDDARQVLTNNINITKGVLEGGPRSKGQDYATVFERPNGNSCEFEVIWGEKDEKNQARLEIQNNELKQILMKVEALNAEYAQEIRDQERERTKLLAAQALVGRIAQGYVHDLANRNSRLSMFLQAEEMYRSTGMENRAVEYRRQADEELQSLQDIMRDFQEFTLKKKLHYKMQPTSIDQVVDRYVSRMMKTAEEKGVTIKHQYGYQGAVNVDLYKFPRITENILGNAIKVLSKGGQVTVRTYSQDGKVCIEYQDNGPGIPPEIQQNLFEPGVSGTGSTGLGMEIVKMFVEAHDGEITYLTGNGGTIFTVTIPTYDERADTTTGIDG